MQMFVDGVIIHEHKTRGQFLKVLFKSIHCTLKALIFKCSTLLGVHGLIHERDSMKGNKVVKARVTRPFSLVKPH